MVTGGIRVSARETQAQASRNFPGLTDFLSWALAVVEAQESAGEAGPKRRDWQLLASWQGGSSLGLSSWGLGDSGLGWAWACDPES